MALYYSITESEVLDMAEKIIKKYFPHLKMSDIHWVWKESDKSTYAARTYLIQGPVATMTPCKIMIVIHKETWEEKEESWQALLLYHEFYHILWSEEKARFSLLRHDIQDFAVILKQFGVEWENSDKFLETLGK